MVKRISRMRERLIWVSLYMKIAWLRFKTLKIEMLKSEFLLYTFFILLTGLGLGMVWRAYQVESHLKAQIVLLETSRSELAKALYSFGKIPIDLDNKHF